jgi:hypothetical protein
MVVVTGHNRAITTAISSSPRGRESIGSVESSADRGHRSAQPLLVGRRPLAGGADIGNIQRPMAEFTVSGRDADASQI